MTLIVIALGHPSDNQKSIADRNVNLTDTLVSTGLEGIKPKIICFSNCLNTIQINDDLMFRCQQ